MSADSLLGAILILILSVAAQPDQPTTSTPVHSQAQQEPITWHSGPHWRGSFPEASRTNYICPGHRIEVRQRFRALHPSGGPAVEIEAVLIDGHPIAAERLAALNAQLSSSNSPLDLYPVCSRNRVGVQFMRVERSGAPGSAMFELN